MTTKKTYIVFLVPLADLYSFYLDFQFHVGMVEFQLSSCICKNKRLDNSPVLYLIVIKCRWQDALGCSRKLYLSFFPHLPPSPSLMLSHFCTLSHTFSQTLSLSHFYLSIYLSLQLTSSPLLVVSPSHLLPSIILPFIKITGLLLA